LRGKFPQQQQSNNLEQLFCFHPINFNAEKWEKQHKVKTTSAEELRQPDQPAVPASSYRLSENPNMAGGNFRTLYSGTVLPMCCGFSPFR